MPNYRRAHLPGGKVSHDRELLSRKAGGSLPYTYWALSLLVLAMFCSLCSVTGDPRNIRFVRGTIGNLAEHGGYFPNPTIGALIDRAAMLKAVGG